MTSGKFFPHELRLFQFFSFKVNSFFSQWKSPTDAEIIIYLHLKFVWNVYKLTGHNLVSPVCVCLYCSISIQVLESNGAWNGFGPTIGQDKLVENQGVWGLQIECLDYSYPSQRDRVTRCLILFWGAQVESFKLQKSV